MDTETDPDAGTDIRPKNGYSNDWGPDMDEIEVWVCAMGPVFVQ